jgi:hypothetical protein
MRRIRLPNFVAGLYDSILCFTLNIKQTALQTGLMMQIAFIFDLIAIFILKMAVIVVQLLLKNIDVAL